LAGNRIGNRLGHFRLGQARPETTHGVHQWSCRAKKLLDLGVALARDICAGVFFCQVRCCIGCTRCVPVGRTVMAGREPLFYQERTAARSGRDVGNQLHLEERDVVLQLQAPLFQAPQLQFFMLTVGAEHVDDGVEIAMFHFQFDDAFFYVFYKLIHGKVSVLIIAILSYRTFCVG
jgi:hypothetical protein